MAIPALQAEAELFMEERLARLEANVEHIQSDISEMKIDIRRLDTKIDAVKDAVNTLELKVERSLAGLELKMEKSFASLRIGRMLDRIWWLVIAGTILGVMARGFKWI